MKWMKESKLDVLIPDTCATNEHHVFAPNICQKVAEVF